MKSKRTVRVAEEIILNDAYGGRPTVCTERAEGETFFTLTLGGVHLALDRRSGNALIEHLRAAVEALP